jgi:predicted nucleic acid-binding protein
MTKRSPKVFLDSSVIFAAVLSPSGGARKLFYLGEAGVVRLVVGQKVLSEVEEVVRRKAPTSLPLLAKLLAAGRVETVQTSVSEDLQLAQSYISYPSDARVLAEAIGAHPDWFVTHDREHFLKKKRNIDLPFQIGTPGDLIDQLKKGFETE